MSGMVVEVSARKFAVPFECPCCGAVPDSETLVSFTRTSGKRVVRETTRGLSFPYCSRCLAHVRISESAGVASSGVMLVGIVVGLIIAIAGQVAVGLLVIAAAIPLAMLLAASRRSAATAACGPSCASPGVALAYLGWSGSVSAFSFESLTYAARFAEQNAKKLINASPQLRQLLDGHRIARLSVPTPAMAAMTVPPPPSALDWIARIESYKGPVARRNALQRALEVVHEPTERQELLLAASRIETAAVLDRVDRLSSHAAKKRLLIHAIEEIRADNIPDELQEAELRQLETHLRQIG